MQASAKKKVPEIPESTVIAVFMVMKIPMVRGIATGMLWTDDLQTWKYRGSIKLRGDNRVEIPMPEMPEEHRTNKAASLLLLRAGMARAGLRLFAPRPPTEVIVDGGPRVLERKLAAFAELDLDYVKREVMDGSGR